MNSQSNNNNYIYNDYELSSRSSNTHEKKLSPSRSNKRTPKGDRFIPCIEDIELSHFRLTKENSNPQESSSPAKLDYSNALENSLFEGKTQKVLAFKEKAPLPRHIHNNPIHCLYSTNKTSESAPKKLHRHIPEVCERTLDAPDMVDDYYLNLLDWSSTNILAVALGTAVYLWNASTSEITSLLRFNDPDNIVTSLSWMHDGSYLAVGTNANTIQLWDVKQQRKVREMKGHQSRVSSLAWNQYILSSGGRDTNIFNHDVRIHEHRVATLYHHTQEVCGLRWSHDGTLLASGGNDNQLNIWDVNGVNNEQPLFSLNQHQAAVKALSWCPFQSNLLASGGGTADRCIRFWNTSTGACLNTVDTKSQVCQILWSKNYRELVSSHGYSQNQLIVWKYPTMTKMAELKGHSSRVLQLAQSPDGETVVSGAGDETLRFWKIFEKEHKVVSSSKAAASTLMSASTMIR